VVEMVFFTTSGEVWIPSPFFSSMNCLIKFSTVCDFVKRGVTFSKSFRTFLVTENDITNFLSVSSSFFRLNNLQFDKSHPAF
jgi:hypothetical protein